MNKTIRLKVKTDENSPVINFEEKEKRRISKLTSNNFNIEFLGVDKEGNEIYRGEKDSWENFVKYLFNVYKKHFSVVDDKNNLIFNDKTQENANDIKEVGDTINKINNKIDNKVGNTVTLKISDYDVMKKKAEAFDKLIEIVCRDGVKFHQEWNREEIRKNVKGGSVKVGEVIGCWHGEIRFTGDDGQKDFGEFVKVMIDGMDEDMKRKIVGE